MGIGLFADFGGIGMVEFEVENDAVENSHLRECSFFAGVVIGGTAWAVVVEEFA